MQEQITDHLYSEIDVTNETAKELGLTPVEYEKICGVLGRVPTYTELGIYSVMWSEHCSYKNSILQLKTLPRSGGRMLVEAGEENAGLIDIGDGYAICFKIESHNHPSAVEPFQGAATGVGGILRDIFTMGARPVAALNSLRFGNLDNDRTKYLLKGIVHGIGHYGNCFGVPTVGGEVYFDECYTDNPLVNAMAVGIVKVGETASAIAIGAGNPVMILGSSTGRDGIHGASLLASREFDEKTEDMRPTVQVGDPFSEKLLLEATLELIASGCIVGMQDMGAAGICCSTSEMSAKGNAGMKINLDLVPLREAGMSAYEIMLSESQERMLAIVEKGKEHIAREICEKWDVPMTEIGEVTDDGVVCVFRFDKQVVDIPAQSLVLGGGAPVYVREFSEPSYISDVRAAEFTIDNSRNSEMFWKILNSPTIASKKWIYQQYDSQVRTNTMNIKGDAAVMRIKELPGKGFAVCTDCNSRYAYLNPYRGGMIAVAEAARNVVCVGAEPVAITNCLNFGNPYDPEVYYQFKEAIRGMGDACRSLETPVTGGNVSFHNQSRNHAIFPTPTIGMLGLIDDVTQTCGSGFRAIGDIIMILGNNSREELGGSEYIKQLTGKILGDAPMIDIGEEKRLQKTALAVIRSGLIHSAHDCSDGGLAITLAEMAINSVGSLGAEITSGFGDTAVQLFGEMQSRIVVSVQPEHIDSIRVLCTENDVDCMEIGKVVFDDFSIGSISTTVELLREEYNSALETAVLG
ncbi:MAG: phosphoribosylformylglycinamidine synthase subunit PurL [Ignavibacteriae bacterium]|nr:phosphoribosylformylglycinamidine synthase subunit PurL [Ignavibacteriota bacterium]